ncbi:TonB family protein [Chitinimonas naiadis]
MPHVFTLLLLVTTLALPVMAGELIGDAGIIGRPQLITAPEYPAEALTNKVTGKLLVEMQIDEQGFSTGYSILKSDPPGQFDAAFEAVAKWWVYYPLIKDCKPVAGKVVNSISFDLPAGKPSVVVEVQSEWNLNNPAPSRTLNSIYQELPEGKYPETALYDGKEGFVLARFERNETTDLLSPQIVFSRPAKVFDSAVRMALKRAKLKPLPPDSQEDKVVCQLFTFTIKRS